MFDLELEDLCATRSPGAKIMPGMRAFSEGILTCKKLKSTIYTYSTSVNLTDIEFNSSFINDMTYLWAGFTDNKVEGKFISEDGLINISSTNLTWLWGEPNGNTKQNCTAIQGRYSNLVFDYHCEEGKAMTTCLIRDIPVFEIRGNLGDLTFDKYIINMDENLGPDQYYFEGYFGSKITPRKSKLGPLIEWIFKYEFIQANCTTNDLPLGTNKWYFPRPDSPFFLTLNLNACNESEFSCTDGTCIHKYGRCNQIFECPDNSDEVECNRINIPEGYQKIVHPSAGKGENMDLDLFVDILHILNMDNENKLFKLKFEISSMWQDERLEFHNLQTNIEDNQVDATEWKQIWIPNILFYNTEEGFTSEQMENNDQSKVFLKRLSEETLPDNKSELIKNFVYKGENVKIYKSNEYTVSFICDFDWEYYPFDTQICSMNLSVSTSKAKLLNFNVTVKLSAEPYSTYKISIDSSSIIQAEKRKIMQISLKFKRDIIPIVLNTYLPTLVLTIINQLSNYFIGPEMFEAVIAINSTVLMTLASMFISTLSSLPNTVYIKYIDIWMLVTFVYPFIIILIHTCVHVLFKKGDKNKIKMMNYLLMFGRVVVPALFMVFCLGYSIVGYNHQVSMSK